MTADRREWFKVIYFLGALIVFASNLTALLLVRKGLLLLNNKWCGLIPECMKQIDVIQYKLNVLNEWQWAGFIIFLAGFTAYHWPLIKKAMEELKEHEATLDK